MADVIAVHTFDKDGLPVYRGTWRDFDGYVKHVSIFSNNQ